MTGLLIDQDKGSIHVGGADSFIDPANDADVQGGRLNDWTVGINSYLNAHTKFQLNYIRAFLNSPINGDSRANVGTEGHLHHWGK